MGIDFTRLRYFLAVADELHFKRAADRLHITPPPLSKQIKLLEREFGGELFERDYHEVRLTALGAALVEPVRRILDQVGDLKATADSVIRRVGPLRVGATAYAPSEHLEAFEREVAALSCAFAITGSAAEVSAQLVAGHLDLGLIHLPVTDPRLEHRPIVRYQGGIAVRGDDPLAVRDMVSIEDLRDREVVADFARPNPAILAALTARLNRHGVTRIVQATATARGSEIEMAAQTRSRHLVVLVGYTPDSLIGRVFAPPDFKLIPIDEASWGASELAIAWCPARAGRHPGLASAIDHLTSAFDPAPRATTAR
jgi:DNA-binding transcriptional LysR family regulator